MFRFVYDHHVHLQATSRNTSFESLRAGQVCHLLLAKGLESELMNVQDYASRQSHFCIRCHLIPLHLLPYC
jgi:hypothetical protein